MLDFYEKRKLKNILFSKITILVLLVACFFLARSVYERYEKERETAHRTAERAAVLRELEARAATLEERVEYAESERGIEEELRNRYDVVKKGEQAVVLMEESTSYDSDVSTENDVVNKSHSIFSWFIFWR